MPSARSNGIWSTKVPRPNQPFDACEDKAIFLQDCNENAMGRTRKGKVQVLKDFSGMTSTHGVGFIAAAETRITRSIWTTLVFITLICSALSFYFLLIKFFSFDKIIDLRLKFDIAEFPAVTVCNLNPYKQSGLKSVPEIQALLNVYDGLKKQPGLPSHAKRATNRRSRKLVEIPCYCSSRTADCSANGKDTCYCVDLMDGDLPYPCYDKSTWELFQCSHCDMDEDSDSQGFCYRTSKSVDPSGPHPCLCHGKMGCLYAPLPLKSTAQEVIHVKTEKEVIQEQAQEMGFGEMTDSVAITAKAKENLVFDMATVELERRINLSYALDEFILECSFNSQQCHKERDFKLVVDPVYGNCYTFNHNISFNRTSSRPGPLYGLRILAYSNVTDYMTTTEAGGVRLAIHDKTEHPFPDTFGYSAPLGTLSSFGIKLKVVKRLGPPYGDCLMSGDKPTNYTYAHDYTTEGCFRSCFQRTLIDTCSCGDPRFPLPENGTICASTNKEQRDCLESTTQQIGDFHKVKGCDCKQPCDQSLYIMTYSAARWPADHFEMGNCDKGQGMCILEYRSNAALFEVYYEQSSHEIAVEKEAYGIVSLLADFGGQAGLWLGFSVITITEWIFLCCSLASLSYRERKDKKIPTIETPEKHPHPYDYDFSFIDKSQRPSRD